MLYKKFKNIFLEYINIFEYNIKYFVIIKYIYYYCLNNYNYLNNIYIYLI